MHRIIQELTNFIIKHARASQLHLQLLKDEEDLVLTVEGNGIGFNLEKAKASKTTAFHSLQSRCHSLNAHLHIEPSKNRAIVIVNIGVN